MDDVTQRIEEWLRQQVALAGVNGVVLGLSGGIDSAVVCGLSARALGAENVLGLVMPAHSSEADVEHGILTGVTFGVEHHVVDLSDLYDAFIALLPEGSQMADANIKARLRMITNYHYANTLNRLVVGTGNKSELTIGYFTKYGDGGVDLLPIGGLLKTQVREIARQIGVPQVIIDRAPSAGLWEGQTDEGEMGLTYEQLDATISALERGDASAIDSDVLARVQAMHDGSAHKRRLAPICNLGDIDDAS